MTNDHNLPWWLVKSIQKTMDEYDGGDEPDDDLPF